jgi:DNA mismatch repair protein MutL
MSDIINLLPDSVANQIAAGEVIQRPASAVKELLENSVDAGADDIKLIIKDAGKTLIQIVDNGCGMSPTDARMSFERHATSKIKNANDLFHIQTMGFRGEALASIAAIAHVELKTKPHDSEMGSQIIVEGSRVLNQTEIVCSAGTSFSVRNLFFNTPARRNFLKTDIQEVRHVTEEFYRVALIHPDIQFSFIENGKQKFLLNSGSFKQRIISLFGKNYINRLLSVEETTTVVEINGFIGKPETARKTRGEQYFFVNQRFIKHPYLNHAVVAAFDELIPDGSFPAYFIHLKVNPELIDVNIHPTKTEVNFRDEKAIYSIIRAAVKMALGKYSLSPQIDFDVEQSLNLAPLPPGTPIRPPKVHVNPGYNPFEQNDESNRFPSNPPAQNWHKPQSGNNNDWQKLFEKSDITIEPDQLDLNSTSLKLSQLNFQSISNQYLVAVTEDGLLYIDRHLAHERVLYDRFSALSVNGSGSSQRKMFPDRVEFSAPDAELLIELLPEMSALGFEIIPLGNNEFDILGAPPDLADESLSPILEGMMDFYKLNRMELRVDKRMNVILSMARNLAVRPGVRLSNEEVASLVEALEESAMPFEAPSGKPIIKKFLTEDITKLFKS